MGYTNYWIFKDENCQGQYTIAKKEIREFIKWARKVHKYEIRCGRFKKPDDSLAFNGVGDDAGEEFYLDDYISLARSFNYCKTGSNDYDGMVIASLFILKKYLQNSIQLKSDGFNHKSIEPNWPEYCDTEIKTGYKLFKEFQATLPTNWKSDGIIPMFKK